MKPNTFASPTGAYSTAPRVELTSCEFHAVLELTLARGTVEKHLLFLTYVP